MALPCDYAGSIGADHSEVRQEAQDEKSTKNTEWWW